MTHNPRKGDTHTRRDKQTYNGRHTNLQTETHKPSQGDTQTLEGRHTNLQRETHKPTRGDITLKIERKVTREKHKPSKGDTNLQKETHKHERENTQSYGG